MPSADPARCRLYFVATHGDDSKEARALRRGAERGLLHRVRRGVYVTASDWDDLDARGRHVVAVRAVASGLPREVVASHESAAALHDLPRVQLVDDDLVRLTDARRATSKRSGRTHLRPGVVDRSERVVVAGVCTTSLARTAVDLARTALFADAVLCLDAVLRREVLGGRHRSGPAVEALLRRRRDELLDMVGPPHHKGGRAATRAIEFASPWAENGGESLARIALHELGVDEIVLQRQFFVGGRLAGRGDLHLPDGALVEFDGMEKLVDGRMLAGRSTAQALREQKARDRQLLRSAEVRTVIHCDYLDVVHPHRLAELLRGGGVTIDPRRVEAASRAARSRFRRPPSTPFRT